MTAAHPDPQRIIQLATGFMAAKYVLVAAELGLFVELGGDGATSDELAARCGLPPRTTRLLADALVQLGLLERDADRYRNAPDAEAFLTGRGQIDWRPLLRYWDTVSYPGWVDAIRAVRTGEGVREPLSEAQTEAYEDGIAISTAPGAAALAATVDFEGHTRLLDVGGGAGSFLTAVLSQHAHLSGTLFDLPEVADLVKPRYAAGPLAGRVSVLGGDMFSDPIPAGHDAIVVAHVLHLYQPVRNRQLLARLREAAAPDARLLLVDWWLDPADPNPTTVLAAGEFLTISGGDVYRHDEVAEWLVDAGWRPDGDTSTPLFGPMGLIAAHAD
jgi:hypothetical protein